MQYLKLLYQTWGQYTPIAGITAQYILSLLQAITGICAVVQKPFHNGKIARFICKPKLTLMKTIKQLSLFIAILLWAIIIGGIVYAHIAFLPGYLNNLPYSTRLVTGVDAIREEKFWMLIHPLMIVFTLLALVLNWKQHERRKLILPAALIYTVVIVTTAIYFVPALMEFAKSNTNTAFSPAQWQEKGKTWEQLSWIRGAFMFGAFIMLLTALTKPIQPKQA